MMHSGSVVLSPITAADLDDVGEFLHRELDSRLSPSRWAAAMVPSWTVDAPNHGFMVRDGGAVVGAYLAFYSERSREGRTESFCNLAAWCVLQSHRGDGLRLLRALLAQQGYHFTDFSPTGNVVALNKRLGFVELDTTKVLVPNLPWPMRSRGVRLLTAPGDIEDVLTGEDLARFRDHREAAAARQVVMVEDDGRTCHVIARRITRRRLPIFASVLHVSDPDVFARHQALIYRHLLLRLRAAATLAELRVVGSPPSLGRRLGHRGPKMFRSDTLEDADIDYLYSELTCVPW